MKLKAGWPSSRESLNNNETYQFTAEVETKRQEAASLFREADSCTQSSCNQIACDKRKQALKLMRLAFFLNPNDNELRQQLAEIYRAEGFSEQALFYDSPVTARRNPQVAQEMKDRELIKNIGGGNVNAVRRLIADGASILTLGGSEDESGTSTIFHILNRSRMTQGQKKEILEILTPQIQSNIIALQGPEHEKTRTMIGKLAIEVGQERLLGYMLDHGLSPDAEHDGDPLVVMATKADQGGTIRTLIEKGATLNPAKGKYPLDIIMANNYNPHWEDHFLWLVSANWHVPMLPHKKR